MKNQFILFVAFQSLTLRDDKIRCKSSFNTNLTYISCLKANSRVIWADLLENDSTVFMLFYML